MRRFASVMVACMPPRYELVTENYFSYFSNKIYVVGTRKNRLNMLKFRDKKIIVILL